MKFFIFLKVQVFSHKTKIGFRSVQSMHVVLQICPEHACGVADLNLFSLYRFHLELSDLSSKKYFATFSHKKLHIARKKWVSMYVFCRMKTRNNIKKNKLFGQKCFLHKEGFKNHFVIYSENVRYAIQHIESLQYLTLYPNTTCCVPSCPPRQVCLSSPSPTPRWSWWRRGGRRPGQPAGHAFRGQTVQVSIFLYQRGWDAEQFM